MVGVALGRLWDAHPKLAFVCHLCITLTLGGATVAFVLSGTPWLAVVIVGLGFIAMAAILVFFTGLAIQNHWQPDDHSYGTDAHSRLANPRAAWGSAQARERALWTAFAVVFLVGLALSMAKNVLGLAFILLAIALALVAVRIRK
jgi:hypothetical protein